MVCFEDVVGPSLGGSETLLFMDEGALRVHLKYFTLFSKDKQKSQGFGRA